MPISPVGTRALVLELERAEEVRLLEQYSLRSVFWAGVEESRPYLADDRARSELV